MSRNKLVALSKVRKQPQWRLIVDSVECYLRDLPRSERAQIYAHGVAQMQVYSGKTKRRESANAVQFSEVSFRRVLLRVARGGATLTLSLLAGLLVSARSNGRQHDDGCGAAARVQ